MCELITKQTGFDYSASIKPSLVTERQDDTYPFIQNKDFNGNDINVNTDFYIPVDVAEEFPKILLDKPSVLISISGRIGNVGFYRLPEKAFIGGAVGICKLKNPDDGEFIIQELESDYGQKYFQSLIKASSHANITVEDIRNIELVFPKNDGERKQISAFLNRLDHLITLHQRKYDKLQVLKKAMLEKMFPKNGSSVPEIRFKGFTDAWEQRKLGDTNTYFTDGNYGEAYPKPSDMTDSSEGVPFLTGSNLKGGSLDITGVSYITKEKHEKLASGHLIEDDIVIAVRGSLGALGYVNKGNSGWNINSQLAILRTDKTELSGKYMLQFLLSGNGQIELLKRQTGSALKQLPINAIKDVDIPITSIEEQSKIGQYFVNLDSLITLHQRELEKLQNIKKSMLEKMFV